MRGCVVKECGGVVVKEIVSLLSSTIFEKICKILLTNEQRVDKTV